MTSPGHVFLAFDTGEPRENLWLFAHRNLQALVHGATVWLPVETTLLRLSGGFFLEPGTGRHGGRSVPNLGFGRVR
jgi:hypothetical protein